MKNYITGKSNIRTKTEKYLHRLLVGLAVVSVFILSIGFVSIVVWAFFGLYMDEPTFISLILLFIIVSYFVGLYFDKDNA